MVFQNFHLFPHLSVRRNLTMPLMKVKGTGKEQANALALETLKKVGMGDRIDAMPSTLSGGQKQRVVAWQFVWLRGASKFVGAFPRLGLVV